MIADIIKNSADIGIIKGDAIFWIGLALVLLACIWRVFKADKKARDAEDKLEKYKREVDANASGDMFAINQKDNNLAIGNMTGNVVLPDVKKKENLNKLDILTHKLVNEILLYKVYSDKEISAKQLANEFFDFSQNNRVEMSPVLEKLVFDKMFREVRNLISQMVIIHGMIWVRNGEIAAKTPFENLSPLPKIDGIEDELLSLRDKIHEEIYNTSHP
ncbi:MAG: hypothetical protein FD146_2203 [Anaerolineaceae bacterium]|nr:MAG: hypothetical protein FD146_2203 [Anaerolineaceae bacterium]